METEPRGELMGKFSVYFKDTEFKVDVVNIEGRKIFTFDDGEGIQDQISISSEGRVSHGLYNVSDEKVELIKRPGREQTQELVRVVLEQGPEDIKSALVELVSPRRGEAQV